jgi:hypothetical protein
VKQSATDRIRERVEVREAVAESKTDPMVEADLEALDAEAQTAALPPIIAAPSNQQWWIDNFPWGEHGAFDSCVSEASGKVDDPEAFCATIHHAATGYWPGEGKGGKTAAYVEEDHPRDDAGRWTSGGRVEAQGVVAARFEPVKALADARNRYLEAHGLNGDYPFMQITRSPSIVKELGETYKALPTSEESARPYYEAMRAEVAEQWQLLTGPKSEGGAGINVTFQTEDPYPQGGDRGFARMMEDLRNGEMKVMRIGGEEDAPQAHPFFTNEEYTQFRAVHDAFGHAASGRGFDRHGEEAAWVSHVSMFGPSADRAVTTETRGQNSYLGNYHEFPDYKMALVDPKFATPNIRPRGPNTDALIAAAPMEVGWDSPNAHVCCTGGHINVPVLDRTDGGPIPKGKTGAAVNVIAANMARENLARGGRAEKSPTAGWSRSDLDDLKALVSLIEKANKSGDPKDLERAQKTADKVSGKVFDRALKVTGNPEAKSGGGYDDDEHPRDDEGKFRNK